MFPEWFQPFEYIDFVNVEGKLQQIWRGSGGDKNSENMLVFRINLNSNFFFFYSSNTPKAGAKLTLPKKICTMHRASISEKVQISGWDILAWRTHYPYFKKEEKTFKPSKSFLRYRNDILDVFCYSEPNGNGLKWAKSRKFWECPPLRF